MGMNSGVLSDFINRIHRCSVKVLAAAIATVNRGDVFDQHTGFAAPKNFRHQDHPGRLLATNRALKL